ncbi:toll/interleukin-1 receptor domain-containing protein [Leisingera caerulea]|uniref:Toll/interleukin-1 receptor domain-containing protein n=1 Tax=Leisingera caerulea TaxID=506591 RepID=A0ABY5WYE3_LEICA|nr:toll/interleukin-1 receptor domain-containing protein [Leisingera caerulea]UWQ59346.1 toll/interleukin-1 receptor domain-containing protein [Leisingera caerulea]
MRQTKIFCSYAWEDTEEIANLKTSWLGELHEAIELKLGTRNTRSPYRLLRDRDGIVFGGDSISQKIAAAILECDIALLFVSEAYILSPDCAKEARLLAEQDKTIIVVEMFMEWHKRPDSELGDLGQELRDDKLAIKFWEMYDASPRLIADPLPSRVSRQKYETFYDRVHDLQKAIRHHAMELASRQGAPEAAPAPSSAESGQQFDLFLATPTTEEAQLTQRLKVAIESKGFSVAHFDLTDPNVTNGWGLQDLLQIMQSCHHFAQVVGSVPGRADLLGSGNSLVLAQYEAALEAGHVAHILLRPGVEPSDCGETHRAFLERCGYQPSTFEDFESCLVKHLKEARQKAEALARREELIQAQEDSERKVIAIDFDPLDRDKYDLLSSVLRAHVLVGDAIMDNPDKAEMKAAVDENDAILVVYGKERGAQKRAKTHFQHYFRLSGTKHQEYCKLAIGNAAPRSAPPCPEGPGVHRIDVRSGVDLKAVNDFLNSLGIHSVAAESGN